MRIKLFSGLFALVLIAGLLGTGFTTAQAKRPVQDAPYNQYGMWPITNHNRGNLPNAVANFEFVLLSNSVSLWADGKGNLILEQHVRNLSDNVFSELTWYFNWPSGSYTEISAADTSGPLVVTTRADGNILYVTVKFRKAVPRNAIYSFKLRVTIGSMASGYGDTWGAYWNVTTPNNVSSFEQKVSFPTNCNITSIVPTPTERRGNYLIWRFYETSINLTISVPYMLSNQINVPLQLQTSLPWGPDTYAHNDPGTDGTIANYGCFLTSGSMLVNYIAGSQDQNFRTNPGVFNTWMHDNAGYTKYNEVRHAWIGKYARTNSVQLYWNQSVGINNTLLDYYLRSGYPVILGVNPKWSAEDQEYYPTHWVLATGKTTVNSVNTYAINDPVYGQTTLQQRWNNYYMDMVAFSASEADQRDFHFVAQSPIHFVVTDPLGRKAGYDPSTNTYWSEIPGAYYLFEALAPEGVGETRFYKSLTVPNPLDGNYSITVHGIGTGNYTMEAASLDWQSIPDVHVFQGMAQPGSVSQHTAPYHSVVNQIFLPLILR